MNAAIIAVFVAFLSNGSYDYGSRAVGSVEECHAVVEDVVRQRLAQAENEDVKVVGFAAKCLEVDGPPPDEQAPEKKPPHVPGKDEA